MSSPQPHADIVAKGKFWLIASAVVTADGAELASKLLSDVRSHAQTNEKGTLQYIVLRGAGDESTHFTILEQHESTDALAEHRSSAAYKELFSHPEVMVSLSIKFSAEI